MNKEISHIIKALAFVALFFSTVNTALAMNFTAGMMKGEPVIIGDGPIMSGDAGRLKAVLIPRNKHSAGYYPLLLNSLGGSMPAAFELSKLIDKYPINTYIISGARCVSACAAIVFIAGKEHVAVAGSQLGFHGCVNIAKNASNNLCSETIANHVMEHGTAYGSVMAFVQHTPNNEVIWLDGRDADCWGINRYQISPTPKGYEKCVFDMFKNVKKQSKPT